MLRIVCVFIAVALGPTQLFAQDHPSVLSAVAPWYGLGIAAGSVSGDVIVTVTIDKDGTVIDTEAEGHKVLTPSAVRAAQRWKFIGGSEVRRTKLRFRYRLLPRDTDFFDLTPVFTPPSTIEVRRAYPPEGTAIPSADPGAAKVGKGKPVARISVLRSAAFPTAHSSRYPRQATVATTPPPCRGYAARTSIRDSSS